MMQKPTTLLPHTEKNLGEGFALSYSNSHDNLDTARLKNYPCNKGIYLFMEW